MQKQIVHRLILALAVLWQASADVMMTARADGGAPSKQTLPDLSFLRGTWCGKGENGSYVEEYWSEPQGDGMIGHCRFVKDGTTTFYELLAIVSKPTGVALRMRHFDGAFKGWDEKDEAGDCMLVGCTADEVVFDNSNREHRVKVTYRRTGAKSLYAAVEDTQAGKTSTYPFEYKLVE